MKVTRVIREYIEEEINKKIKEHPEMLRLREEARREIEAWNRDFEPFKKEVEQRLVEIAEKHQMFFYESYDGTKGYPQVSFYNLMYDDLPVRRKMNQLSIRLRADRDKVVRDICFKLEMGATKDQIQGMLDAVKF